jgi:hypothetical protein
MQHSIPKYRQPTTHANKIHAADAVPSEIIDNLLLVHYMDPPHYIQKITITYQPCKQF